MKQKGTLTKWDDDRGFGFITSTDSDEAVFVHISAFARGQERPALNRSLTYRLVRDEKQRPRAEDARFMVTRRPVRTRSQGLIPAIVIVAAFFVGLAALISALEWKRLAGLYTFVSVVAFVMYGLDKRAATRGGWRTSEARLHFFELIGGWPGALLAQRVFRHKIRKTSFQVVFYLAVAANLAALGWLLYADSGAALRAALGVSRVAGEWPWGRLSF